MIAFGVVAFISLGYFGYSDDPPILGAAFHDPWPLFLWLCLLFFPLQVAILRHSLLRRQRTMASVAALLSMALVGGAWYAGSVRRFVLDTSLARGLLSPSYILLMVIVGIQLIVFLLALWLAWLRVVLASLLTLLGIVGLLLGAQFSAIYMHTDAGHTLSGDPRLAFGRLLAIFLVAAAGIADGLIAAAAVCALLVYHLRVLTNTARFLLFFPPVFAYVLLPTFAVINTIVWLTGISFRTPFFQPSVSGLITVIVFIVTGGKWVLSALAAVTGTNMQPSTHANGQAQQPPA